MPATFERWPRYSCIPADLHDLAAIGHTASAPKAWAAELWLPAAAIQTVATGECLGLDF